MCPVVIDFTVVVLPKPLIVTVEWDPDTVTSATINGLTVTARQI